MGGIILHLVKDVTEAVGGMIETATAEEVTAMIVGVRTEVHQTEVAIRGLLDEIVQDPDRGTEYPSEMTATAEIFMAVTVTEEVEVKTALVTGMTAMAEAVAVGIEMTAEVEDARIDRVTVMIATAGAVVAVLMTADMVVVVMTADMVAVVMIEVMEVTMIEVMVVTMIEVMAVTMTAVTTSKLNVEIMMIADSEVTMIDEVEVMTTEEAEVTTTADMMIDAAVLAVTMTAVVAAMVGILDMMTEAVQIFTMIVEEMVDVQIFQMIVVESVCYNFIGEKRTLGKISCFFLA